MNRCPHTYLKLAFLKSFFIPFLPEAQNNRTHSYPRQNTIVTILLKVLKGNVSTEDIESAEDS